MTLSGAARSCHPITHTVSGPSPDEPPRRSGEPANHPSTSAVRRVDSVRAGARGVWGVEGFRPARSRAEDPFVHWVRPGPVPAQPIAPETL